MNKRYIFLATIALLTSCSVKNEKKVNQPETAVDSTELVEQTKIQPTEQPKTSTEDAIIDSLCNEQIDGPANVRYSPNGKLMFELFDGVSVETSPIENDWLMVSTDIQLDSTELQNGIVLPNMKLRNMEGEVIGNSFDTLRFTSYDKLSGSIWGYTYKNNIEPNCTPEAQLNSLIIENRLSFEDQKQYRQVFGFTPFNNNSAEGVSEYIIYQSTLVDPSPRDRISLMYHNDKLFAFVHSRDFDFYNLQSGELIRGHKIVFLTEKNPMLAEEIVEKRLYLYNHSD
ncbi:hypothetical protein [Ekhidna sp.]|uniref:hypothetical protein n=1 Tax=Ekhidna sp. TaxID=2608089 RepID=UPI003CCC181D